MMIKESAIRYEGKVYTGRRHSDIIREMAEKYHVRPPIRGVQGFVTDLGEFLDRKEAHEHFVACGQKSASGKLHKTSLFSEDLY